MGRGDSLEGLLKRVQEAQGPDRELDAAICKAVDPASWARFRNWAAMPCGAPEETVERDAARYAPEVTRSLDEALALVERGVLPGAKWSRNPGGAMAVHVRTERLPFQRTYWSGGCATPALGLLSALLKALSAQHTREGGEG
jgi:hypothetical protein